MVLYTTAPGYDLPATRFLAIVGKCGGKLLRKVEVPEYCVHSQWVIYAVLGYHVSLRQDDAKASEAK